MAAVEIAEVRGLVLAEEAGLAPLLLVVVEVLRAVAWVGTRQAMLSHLGALVVVTLPMRSQGAMRSMVVLAVAVRVIRRVQSPELAEAVPCWAALRAEAVVLLLRRILEPPLMAARAAHTTLIQRAEAARRARRRVERAVPGLLAPEQASAETVVVVAQGTTLEPVERVALVVLPVAVVGAEEEELLQEEQEAQAEEEKL